jgi:hypothetical protein
MELIEKYRSQCYNSHFESDYLWVSYSDQRSEFIRSLNRFQSGDRSTSNFSLGDIDHIFNKISEHKFDPEFTTKLVIQTANFNVKPQTVANGCTTRLLFFLKTEKSWFFYGHAKGRFNNWRLFNIKSGEKLGYSIFLSIGEQDREISSGVPDNMALVRRLIERIKQRNHS